jgi:hypothetical protein
VNQRIGVPEAAQRLGRSSTTVQAMLERGELHGELGTQPHRPRWVVFADDDGRPLRPDGTTHPRAVATATLAMVAALEKRLAALEASATPDSGAVRSDEYRTVALQLNHAFQRMADIRELDKQAIELTMLANAQLHALVQEQAEMIAGLLVGDPTAEATATSPTAGAMPVAPSRPGSV